MDCATYSFSIYTHCSRQKHLLYSGLHHYSNTHLLIFLYSQAHFNSLLGAGNLTSCMKEHVPRAQIGVKHASLISTVLNVTATTTVLSANTHVHRIVMIFATKNMDTAHTGCADGRFPDPNSQRCLKCPSQCRTCKSMTECFECIPGYYGNTCEKRCSSYCKSCNKTTGACLVCAEGFNDAGQCRRCPDGCVSCSNENNCSSCQSGYYTLKGGHCIMECPIASNTSDPEATAYFMGDIMAHGCTDTARGQRFVIKSKKPCIQYTKCSPNIMCAPQDEGKSACGTIKTYQCSYSCGQLNESCCWCEPNCTITERGSIFHSTLLYQRTRVYGHQTVNGVRMFQW